MAHAVFGYWPQANTLESNNKQYGGVANTWPDTSRNQSISHSKSYLCAVVLTTNQVLFKQIETVEGSKGNSVGISKVEEYVFVVEK